jgi:hypothetical protein
MTTENQVFDYLNHVLDTMHVSPILIQKEANLLFDFNFSAKKIDVFYSAVEHQYQVPFILFSPDVATLKGLVCYVLTYQGAEKH